MLLMMSYKTIESSKGISLPIKAVVVLTLAIIVLLAVLSLFTSSWQDEELNQTSQEAGDEFIDMFSESSHRESFHFKVFNKIHKTRKQIDYPLKV